GMLGVELGEALAEPMPDHAVANDDDCLLLLAHLVRTPVRGGIGRWKARTTNGITRHGRRAMRVANSASTDVTASWLSPGGEIPGEGTRVVCQGRAAVRNGPVVSQTLQRRGGRGRTESSGVESNPRANAESCRRDDGKSLVNKGISLIRKINGTGTGPSSLP